MDEVGDGIEDRPIEQLVSGAVTALTLTVAFGLLFAGIPYFWVAFPVGFGGVLPMALGAARLYERRQESAAADTADDEMDPIATLRERYAAGELTDEAFEQQVERLLETEDVEAPDSAVGTRATDVEREPE